MAELDQSPQGDPACCPPARQTYHTDSQRSPPSAWQSQFVPSPFHPLPTYVPLLYRTPVREHSNAGFRQSFAQPSPHDLLAGSYVVLEHAKVGVNDTYAASHKGKPVYLLDVPLTALPDCRPWLTQQ
ncbi:hypothetical protein PMIN05_008602 [Paraphaeosphaeria minitans]